MGRLTQGGLLNVADWNAANRANVVDHLVTRLQSEGCTAPQARRIAFAVDQWIRR